MIKRALFCLLVLGLNVQAQDIQTGLTLSDGVQYHAADFNNTINNATILPTFISGKGVGTPISTDALVYFQGSSSTLKKTTLSSLLSGTAISLTMPTGFVVSGSPVQGTGTLAVTMAPQNANTVLGGPYLRGASAAPSTFRAISPHDTSLVSDATTATTLDCSLFRTFSRTLTANTTFTLSNFVDGETVSIKVKQAAAGGPYTVGISGAVWAGGGAPTMTATANRTDIYTCINVGGVGYCTSTQNFF